MKGALIHGILLVVMLVYGYKTWSRDTAVDKAVTTGDVVLWNKTESDLQAIEYATPTRTVRLEKRGEGAGAHWWGLETKETPPPPPPMPMPTPAPGSPPGPGATPPGHGHGHGSAAVPPAKPGAAPAKPGAAPAKPGAAPAKPATPPAPKPATPAPAAKPPAPAAGSAAAGPAKMADPNAVGSGSAAAPAPKPAQPAPKPAQPSPSPSPSTSTSTSTDDPLGASLAVDTPAPITTTREFPISEAADKTIKSLVSARALRDLGKITEETKKDYKLEDTSTTLSIVFKGMTKNFIIGGSVFGGSDKYVLDTDTNKVYVVAGSMISPFEQGESTLRLQDPRGFDATKIDQVTVAAGDKSRGAKRVMADAPKPATASPHAPPASTKTKTWGDPATGKPDQTLANFVDNLDRLKPTKYEAGLDPATMTEVVKISYQDAKGAGLGTMRLLKREKPPEATPPPGTPPGPVIEYYVLTEKTRVPGLVPKSMAERVDNDIATVFPK